MNKEGRKWSLTRFLLEAGKAVCFTPGDSLPSDEKERAFFKRALPLKMRLLRVKTSLAKTWEQSFFVVASREGFRRLFTTRVRSFGILFFTAGFLQIASYFLRRLSPLPAGSETGFLFGVGLIFLTLFCSFFRGDVRDAVLRSALWRHVLENLFGLKEWQIPRGKSRESLPLMLLGGVLIWGLSLVCSPILLFQGFIAAALIAFTLCRPEAGLITVALLFVFLPPRAFYALTILTMISFLFKCAVGRRSFAFSLPDPIMALAFLPVFFLGRRGAIFLFLSYFSLYYLASSLLRTVSAVGRLFSALQWAGFLSSFMLCLRYALHVFFPSLFLRFPLLSSLLSIEPTAEIGVLFVMLFVLCLGAPLSAAKLSRRLWRIVTLGMLLVGIALVQNAGVWLALAIAVTLYALLSYRAGLIALLFAALSLMTALFILPTQLVWRVAAFFGAGLHETALEEKSVNLFSYLYELSGVVGCLLFLAAIVFVFFEAIRFARTASVKSLFAPVLGALCCTAAFLIASVQSIPFDGKWITLFCLAAAIPAAARRADARESIPPIY